MFAFFGAPLNVRDMVHWCNFSLGFLGKFSFTFLYGFIICCLSSRACRILYSVLSLTWYSCYHVRFYFAHPPCTDVQRAFGWWISFLTSLRTCSQLESFYHFLCSEGLTHGITLLVLVWLPCAVCLCMHSWFLAHVCRWWVLNTCDFQSSLFKPLFLLCNMIMYSDISFYSVNAPPLFWDELFGRRDVLCLRRPQD